MTLLAGKAVGAPFVGSIAATLALSEVLRLLHGGLVHQLIDVDLLGLGQRIASRHPCDFGGLNPGFALAAACPIWPGPGGRGDCQAVLRNADRPTYR